MRTAPRIVPLALGVLLGACDADGPPPDPPPATLGVHTASTAAGSSPAPTAPYADAGLPDPADFADAAAAEIDGGNYARHLDELERELSRPSR